MKPRSLTARLVAGTAVWLLVALAVGGVALSLSFRRAVEGAFDDRLDTLLLAVIGTLEAPPAGTMRVSTPIADSRFERAYSGWYWQVNDGRDRLRSRSLWDAVLPVGAVAGTDAVDIRLVGPRGQHLRGRARALTYPSRLAPVVVAVLGPEAELTGEFRRFDRLLATSLGALGVGLALALAVQVGYGLRPLRRLATELAAVRGGHAARLGGDYPREVQPLVQAMNEVLEHDAGLIERARTHVGNLAHALKTPLAVLKTEATNPAPDGARRITEQVGVMTRLVDHHLTRAAAAASRRVLGARTEVAPVLQALSDTLARIHPSRRVSAEAPPAPGAVFAGERQDLEEMLGNVMDNACKWARGRVHVATRTAAGRIELVVEDDGPGMTDDQAARSLARGARLDDDTPGSGLGLSIAAELAALYGGALTLGRSALGGLRVALTLPAA
jgi:signal transduction histidine kinase